MKAILQSTPILKALSPRLLAKAAESFDRVTLIIVAVAWGVAMLMLAFALYTIHLSLTARQNAEAALASEPILPKQVTKQIEAREIQPVIERLQHMYPDITFAYRNNLSITAGDGSKFHEWLTALGYIDTISPQFHWTLQEFCVGKCGHDLMSAVLNGEKITFEVPQSEEKK